MKKTNEQIAKDIEDLQSKTSKRWYKEPSLVLSVIALIISVYFSVQSIIQSKKEKAEESFSGRVAFVNDAIKKIVDTEKYYVGLQSDQYTSPELKGTLEKLQITEIKVLLDQIDKAFDSAVAEEINSNLLLEYGHYLQRSSKLKEAKEAFAFAESQAVDYIDKAICYRFLGNFYALESEFQNSSLSKAYRRKDIDTSTKYLFGEFRNEYLGDSYMLWAWDEFYYLKNEKRANELLDTSEFYFSSLSESFSKRERHLKNVKRTRHLTFKNIDPSKLKLKWKVKIGNRYGKAMIVQNPMGLSFNAEIFKAGEMVERYSGNGAYTGERTMTFETSRIIMVKDPQYGYNSINNFYGLMELELVDMGEIIGSYFEFGEKGQLVKLTQD